LFQQSYQIRPRSGPSLHGGALNAAIGPPGNDATSSCAGVATVGGATAQALTMEEVGVAEDEEKKEKSGKWRSWVGDSTIA